MVVDMPYGEVIINTTWQATYFIQNHCRDCWMGNEMNPCSGAQSAKCNEIVQRVINYCKVMVQNQNSAITS